MSQDNIDFDFSQEMPPKRQRRYSNRPKKYGAVTKVPKAITTRGTPQGYYELPQRQLYRFYGNSSSGLWNTNQTTAAAIGSTGYQGFGYVTQLDQSAVYLGNGGISATVSQTIADFASAQNLFDLCKVSEIEVEFWISNPSHEANVTAGRFGAVEIYVTQDMNDAFPPNQLSHVLDRTKVIRICQDNRKYKMTFKPNIVLDASSNAGDTSTTTLAISQPSTYVRCDRPAVSHYGIKGWVVVPSDATAFTYTLNMLVTQKRRYKMAQ